MDCTDCTEHRVPHLEEVASLLFAQKQAVTLVKRVHTGTDIGSQVPPSSVLHDQAQVRGREQDLPGAHKVDVSVPKVCLNLQTQGEYKWD